MGPAPDFNSQGFFQGERLKKKKKIDRLFREGDRKMFFPVLMYHLVYPPEEIPYHQILISVPKKHFKSSVVRNKIRRRIREAYRKHKALLYNNYDGFPFLLGYLYISKTVSTYSGIEKSVVSSIRYLIKQNNLTNEVAKR
ncbi:MAG: ribonuclease P protein component [Cyclobacteriaceae bacterium]|nr:ribonuclease P protein component [Cyclobacteriaceae bacterium]